MEIKTAVDKHKYLIFDLIRLVRYEPFSDKFEDSYKNLIKVLLTNIPENKDDLLVLFFDNIEQFNNYMSIPLKSATEKERAFFNAGKVIGLFDLIESLGEYDQCLDKILQPYLNLEIGDVVYILNNEVLYKTTVIKKEKKKIQVKYGNRWFTQNDYLKYIFPYDEKENLYKNGQLSDYRDCDKCAGFRQGKCAYGYSVYTYNGISYRFDNTKYKVLKGRPEEHCCKNIRK